MAAALFANPSDTFADPNYTTKLSLANAFLPPRDLSTTSIPPAEIMGADTSRDFSGATQIQYFARSDRGTIEHYAQVFGGGYSTAVNENWELSGSWRWDDMIFTCDDNRTQVENVRLNVRIKGSQGFTTAFTTNPATSWAYMWASLNNGTCGSCAAGTWYPSGNIHRFVLPSTGIFSGISSTSLDGVFTYKPSTNVGPLNLATNVPVTIQPYALVIRTVARRGWSTAVFNTAGGQLGMTLPTDGPVFELPAGCTCNSVQANIVDNMWLGPELPPSTITVSGRIVSDCEGPVMGVMVDVADANGVVSCVTTDEQGRFTIMGVAGSTEPGHVTVEPPPGYEEIEPITIALTEDLELSDITLACTYVDVSGTVTSSCGDAVGSATVSLSNGDGDLLTTTAAADGSFEFSELRYDGMLWAVTVEPPTGFTVSDSILIDLTEDAVANPVLGCVFVDVAGSVTSGCGEGPLAGVAVNLTSGSTILASATTSADGSYLLSDIRFSSSASEIAVAPPAGFEAIAPSPVDLTADRVVDFALPCVFVSVAGTVTSDCHGAEAGVAVGLAVSGRDALSAVTGSDGAYTMSARYSGTPGDLAITLPAGLEAVSPTGGATQIALTTNQAVDFTTRCRVVDVSGTVASDCGGALTGVTVDLLDAGGAFFTTTTDEAGAYLFEDLLWSAEENAAEVSIAIPLGYEALSPGVAGAAVTLDQDRVVDFSLACLDPAGQPRSMGYWKHNANVYLSGRGSAQESQANMTTAYAAAIFDHFHENTLNGIAVSGVTYVGEPAAALDLATIGATLTVNRGGTMLDRAKQQYLALLLNVASAKLLTSTVVTADERTASQAIQYIADLINDGDGSNDELAKNLSETLNDAQIIGAGVVPDEYGDIAYKIPSRDGTPFTVSPNPGGSRDYKFSFAIAREGEATIEIFDVAGRRVAMLAAGNTAGRREVSWTGVESDGRRIAQGIYFARLSTPDQVEIVKFAHLAR